MIVTILLSIVIVALLIALNALYVAGEFAAVSARKSRISQLAQDGSRTAKTLLPIIEDTHRLDSYIATSQVGITLSSVVLGIYGQRQIAPQLEPLLLPLVNDQLAATGIAALLILIFLTSLQVVLGELVPKSVALLYPESTAMTTVLPMRWSETLLMPLIVILNGSGALILRLLGVEHEGGHKHVHSPEEIQILIGESQEGGLLDADERQLLNNAFRVGEMTAREIAVPRTRMVAAPVDLPTRDLLKLVADSAYTRIPIYEGDMDHILGFVHIKDLFRLHYAGGELRPILRKVPYVPETMDVNEVWATLDREKSYLAIVFDEYGGTLGIITREDVIEELFGEVQDEFDHEKPEITPAGDRCYLVRGDVLIAHINDVLDVDLPDEHADTIGGLVLHLVGRIPRVGDTVTIEGIECKVESMRRRSVLEVSITLPEDTADQAETLQEL